MNPSSSSLGSHPGAKHLDDALDDQFDDQCDDTSDEHSNEQFEYVEQDLTATRDTKREDTCDTNATPGVGAERKTPHITPKIAPPKITKRYSATELPEIGTWVVVNVQDGKRKETFHGRVAVIDTNRLRLKQGAGWWDIPIGSVLSIAAGDDPAHRRR